MKKKTWIAWCAAGLLLAAVLGADIWKVNQKVNALSVSVQEMQQTQQAQGEQILQQSELMALQAEAAAVKDRDSVIPVLDPGTDGWLVTQYGNPGGQQEMCYTITTENGLVIVDGGFSYEVPRLRKIIAEYGNSVEAWILTHPHPDHITAFMDIYEDPQGIIIHHIYTAEQAPQELMEEKAPWDDFSALERFRALNIPNLEYLHKGDQLDLLGLKMEVLSAYDTEMEPLTKDLMNDGSLMFRISGKEDSMLFCADVGTSLTKTLVKEYGETLKSDYLQMGHHGFGGLGKKFYRLVAPRAAFFDAPDWLVNGEDDRSTKKNEELMRAMGCTIFFYYTAPNQILLK